MQAVILAAGRGTRMRELTKETPKPLLRVLGQTLLDQRIAILPPEIDEVIIVIGYQGQRIQEHLGEEAYGKRIRYVSYEEEEVLDGSGGALWEARPHLQGRFVVMSADDLYSAEDVRACIETDGWAMVVSPTEALMEGGRVVTDSTGIVVDIVEGNHGGVPGLNNTNLLVLDERFFAHPPVPKAVGSHEFGLPQTALMVSQREGVPLRAVTSTFWFQICSPEDLAEAEKVLRAKMTT